MKVYLGNEKPLGSVKYPDVSEYVQISLVFGIWSGESRTGQPIRMRRIKLSRDNLHDLHTYIVRGKRFFREQNNLLFLLNSWQKLILYLNTSSCNK